MHLTKSSRALFWLSLILGGLSIVNELFLRVRIPILSEIPNIVLLAIAFIILLFVAILSHTYRELFWVSLVTGILAIFLEFFTDITIPILPPIGNIMLLSIAYILLLIDILLRRH